jgi:hypothetical protein
VRKLGATSSQAVATSVPDVPPGAERQVLRRR